MSDKLNFHFPISLLLKEADTILNAADGHAAQVGPRLPGTNLADARTLADQVEREHATQKGAAGDVGSLTHEQNAKLRVARSNGRRPQDGQARLQRSGRKAERRISGGHQQTQRPRLRAPARPHYSGVAEKSENAAALAAKGWLTTDTQVLGAAIDALGSADSMQEKVKTPRTGTTGQRNPNANDLYEQLLTIQNAANLQWPEKNSANAAIRAEFRLEKFPPRSGSDKKPEPPPTPPTQPPA